MKKLWKKIRYGVWPALKTKLKFKWYSIKYGGRENIPPDVIFDEMEDSVKRLQENLANALRNVPEDVSEDDKGKLLEALQKASDMDAELGEAAKKAKEKFENQD